MEEESVEFRKLFQRVLKYEIKTLLERLADTGEESLIVLASATEGSSAHLGSMKGEGFAGIQDLEELKSQFLHFCMGCPVDGSDNNTVKMPKQEDTDVPVMFIKTEPEEEDAEVGNLVTVHGKMSTTLAVKLPNEEPAEKLRLRKGKPKMMQEKRQHRQQHTVWPYLSSASFIRQGSCTSRHENVNSYVSQVLPTGPLIQNQCHIQDSCDMGKRTESKKQLDTIVNSNLKLSTESAKFKEPCQNKEPQPIMYIEETSDEKLSTVNKELHHEGSVEDLTRMTELYTHIPGNENPSHSFGNRDAAGSTYHSGIVSAQDPSSSRSVLSNAASNVSVKLEDVINRLVEVREVGFVDKVAQFQMSQIETGLSSSQRRRGSEPGLSDLPKSSQYDINISRSSQPEITDLTGLSNSSNNIRVSGPNLPGNGRLSCSSDLSKCSENDNNISESMLTGTNRELDDNTSEQFSNEMTNRRQNASNTNLNSAVIDSLEQEISKKNAFKSIGRLYKCKLCHKILQCKSSIDTHWRLHTGEKPFVCQVCGRAFSNSSNLQKHRVTHTGEKRYQCNICGCLFSTSSNMRRHKLKHTTVLQGQDYDALRASFLLMSK
ncbi:hypothetical protein CHS0354_028841 [Potamilus streckersoni]|uniref:C2H2-type domain-containing protein n=1 Tax=Potamilus streckersoni TaxID=2493646 RepID=A0AAE0TFU4_9BIVA|nr:hypothetical protein CHS0354_028841 [Potamilus streckersoni]